MSRKNRKPTTEEVIHNHGRRSEVEKLLGAKKKIKSTKKTKRKHK